MTSPINNNRCKLLVLDLNTDQITIDDLRTYFTSYGPVEWIETFPSSSSVIIYFVSYLIVDRILNCRTCLIGQDNVRFRRFRSDQSKFHIDSPTLYIKSTLPVYSNNMFTDASLRHCFQDYQSYIHKLEILDNNQALITFSDYDYVDQILLSSSNKFIIEDEPLILERMIPKTPKKSRWDQVPSLLTTIPVLSVRDPVVHKLMTHIEYLTKQIREEPNHSRNEIVRLEAEVFILKNENAQLKSKQELSSNKNIEQRLIALEDISNRLVNKHYDHNRRERSNSHEKQLKRRRQYKIDDDDY